MMMKNKPKIILAGTPEFAVETFEEIIQNFNVLAIISQPDKPANRGYKLQYTPTKILAEKYQIKVYQPEKIIDIYEELKSYDYDILLSCAFGQFIPTKVLELAKKGSLNIHGSLLPKYRGAAPIQHSLLNGDDVTGICLIYMVNKMDAGDIIFEKSINIDLKDTSETLFKKLSSLSAENIVKWLEDFYNGNFKIKKQNEDLVTLAPKLEKQSALIEQDLTVNDAFNKIRAFSSNPGAYLFFQNKRLKVYYASKDFVKNAPEINLSDGKLYAVDYQFESKKRVKLQK